MRLFLSAPLLLSQEQVATAFDSDEPRTGISMRCVAVDRCIRAVWIVDRTDDERKDPNVLKRKGIDRRV